jgi:hypothetical protein
VIVWPARQGSIIIGENDCKKLAKLAVFLTKLFCPLLARPAEDDPEGKNTIKVYGSTRGSGAIPDGTNAQGRKRKDCCKMCWAGLLFLFAFFIAVTFTPLTFTSMLLKHNNQWWEATGTMELLQSDTILAYKGKPPVQIIATVEAGKSTKFNVSLLSVNCEELVIHELYVNVSDLHWYFTTEYPTKLPPGYNHFELESHLKYFITLGGAPNTSELIMRIFSNTLDADQYVSHHTNQSAQKKAVFEQIFKANEPHLVVYEPPVASYYIPIFVAPAGTAANISYYITRKYYVFTDYIQTYIEHCQINSPEMPCYFDFSNGTDVCIIANYAQTSSTNAPRILLTASNARSKDEYVISSHLTVFYVSLCVAILSFLVFVGVCVCCCWKCRKDRKNPTTTYQRVAQGDCGVVSDTDNVL